MYAASQRLQPIADSCSASLDALPSCAQLVPAGNLPANNGIGPLVCPGGMCPLGVSTPAFPPGTDLVST